MPEISLSDAMTRRVQCLLLDVAAERSCSQVMGMIVDRIAQMEHVALCRIWLKRPGDICERCRLRPECPDHSQCLHLVASAGRSQVDPELQWNGTDGDFRRFPIGVRKVGRVAATREQVLITDAAENPDWLVDPDWAQSENIQAFVGQPLLFQGQLLGVLAVFIRTKPLEGGPLWLRIVADHAAAAIANSRAFEEIEELRSQLELENTYLREEVLEAQAFGDIVGHSAPLKNVLQQIEVVAPTDANVLILGESGTGKELVAREIHRHGERKNRPMIKVNCASIPRELYESEFFGHVKGAFTGAVKDRAGRFELADGGTLFLDEVGEIPLELQSKLLRVLQEGSYERVGEERTRQADVRIIAATNRDLKAEVDKGNFRQDLFYRLNVFPIEVSPLRARIEDVPVLAAHFLGQICRKLNREEPRLTQANILQLQAYDWPGNARELQNVMERAVITSKAGSLIFDLPQAGPGYSPGVLTGRNQTDAEEGEVVPDIEIRRREKANLVAALEKAGWKIYGENGAASLLGLKPTTLASRMKKMGVKKPD